MTNTATPPAHESRAPTDQAALGPKQRCPVCHVEFQRVVDVDAHLATFDQAVPSGVDGLVEAAQKIGALPAGFLKRPGIEWILLDGTELTDADVLLRAALSPAPARQALRDALERAHVWMLGSDVDGLALEELREWNALLDEMWAALSLTKSPPQETVEAIIERCARLAEDGFRCRTCGAVFDGAVGHPEPECDRPNWDGLSDAGKGAAIRALKLEQLTSTLNEVGND